MKPDPGDIEICLGHDEDAAARHGAMAPPIYPTSLFAASTLGELIEALDSEHDHYVYSRGKNPTVSVVERKLAALERGEECQCFGSGMGAISAVLTGILNAGDHVLFVNQTYGPTLQLAVRLEDFGVSHDLLLDLDPGAVEAAIRPETRLIWLESPGTMLNRLVDLGAVAMIARKRGILTAIDNSWSTPLLQKPLTSGIDISVHTCTKYLGGHSDLIAGAVITSGEILRSIFHRAALLLGSTLAPFEAWLLIRGMRTLPARMERHETNALAVGEFLAGHPSVTGVYHPAFTSDAELARTQLAGFAGLLSFTLRPPDFASVERVVDALRLFHTGVSWGGVESLVITPQRRGNAAALAAAGIPPGLIRLSVGLEDPASLIADLEGALALV